MDVVGHAIHNCGDVGFQSMRLQRTNSASISVRAVDPPKELFRNRQETLSPGLSSLPDRCNNKAGTGVGVRHRMYS